MKQITQITHVYFSDPEKEIKNMVALGWSVVSKNSWKDSENTPIMTRVVYEKNGWSDEE